MLHSTKSEKVLLTGKCGFPQLCLPAPYAVILALVNGHTNGQLNSHAAKISSKVPNARLIKETRTVPRRSQGVASHRTICPNRSPSRVSRQSQSQIHPSRSHFSSQESLAFLSTTGQLLNGFGCSTPRILSTGVPCPLAFNSGVVVQPTELPALTHNPFSFRSASRSR